MNLTEALKKRHKVLAIIQAQDPVFESISLSQYRVAYLSELEKFISKQINSISHDNYSSKKAETNQWPAGMDMQENSERSGDRQRTMGIAGREKNAAFKRFKLFWRRIEAKVYKITLDREGSYEVH